VVYTGYSASRPPSHAHNIARVFTESCCSCAFPVRQFSTLLQPSCAHQFHTAAHCSSQFLDRPEWSLRHLVATLQCLCALSFTFAASPTFGHLHRGACPVYPSASTLHHRAHCPFQDKASSHATHSPCLSPDVAVFINSATALWCVHSCAASCSVLHNLRGHIQGSVLKSSICSGCGESCQSSGRRVSRAGLGDLSKCYLCTSAAAPVV